MPRAGCQISHYKEIMKVLEFECTEDQGVMPLLSSIRIKGYNIVEVRRVGSRAKVTLCRTRDGLNQASLVDTVAPQQNILSRSGQVQTKRSKMSATSAMPAKRSGG